MRYSIRTITPSVFDTDDYVVLDFETDTSHGDYGHPVHPENGLLLGCYKVAGEETHDLWADEYGMGSLVAAIEDSDLLVAHNAKYELGWLLKRCGLDLRKCPPVFDTKLGEYVLMGNLAAGDDLNAPRSTSLDDCAQRRGMPPKDPVVDTMIKNGINPVRIPKPWLEGRCRQDVDTTERVFLSQREALRDTNRLGVLLTRTLLTPVLAEMECVGMKLDPARVEKTYDEHVALLATYEQEMAGITGGINWKSGTQVAEFLYNPPTPRRKYVETPEGEYPVWLVPNRNGKLTEQVEGSEKMVKMLAYLESKWDKQLSLVPPGTEPPAKPIFQVEAMTTPGLGFAEVTKWDGKPKRTSGGKPMTDQKTLDKLVARTAKQREFIDCRKRLGKVNAALTKSLYFYQGVCKEHGGVFHAEINQTKTATHRTSSTGIPIVFSMYQREGEDNDPKSAQFQNLPNAFKPLFCARGPGRLIAEADGSQLEFRVAGQVSRDAQMVADILDPTFDAHITSAAAMKQIPYAELKARFDAKDPQASEWRKAAKPDTFGPLYGKQFGTPEQLRWIEEFRRRYAGFYEYAEANVHTVLADGVLALPWGMRYYWPHARISSSGYINCSTSVYNYPIQGFATAEIIPIAVASFRQRIAEAEDSGLIKPGDIVILNTVHDSVICDIAAGALDVWKEIARQAFTMDVYAYLRNVYHYDFDLVPLGVGMNYGTHWADKANAEEEWDVYPTGHMVKRK